MSAAVAERAAAESLLPLYGRGFVSVSASEVDRLAQLAPATAAVWAVLRLEASRRGTGGASLPRTWLVERTGGEVTADAVKKIPARVAALVEAGLCLSLVGERSRVQVEFIREPRRRGRGTGEWEPRLRVSDVARAADAADPMSWADLMMWLRWQQVVRTDEVWIRQGDLAARWRVTERTVRREQRRLVELGLLGVDRAPGGVCRYWAAEITTRMQSRVLGAGTSQWIHSDDAIPRAADELGLDVAARSEGPTAEVPDTAFSGAGGPDNLGTDSGQSRHHPGISHLPRVRVHAVALHTLGTSVPISPEQHERLDGADASPRPQPETSTSTSTRPARDQAWKQATRIVNGQRWLASSKAKWQISSVIAMRLRQNLAGVDAAAIARAVAQIDPDEPTDQHVRLVRQAIAGLVADSKAAPAIMRRTILRPTAAVFSEASRPLVDDAGQEPGVVIDLGWMTGPVPAEPRWSRTDPSDPDAIRWLATLWLRGQKLSTAPVLARLPQAWHETAISIRHQVMAAVADPDRPIRLGTVR